MRAASTISRHPDTRTATFELTEALLHQLDGDSPAMVVLMASFHHARALPDAALSIRQRLDPQALVASTAYSVFSGLEHSDGAAGIAAFVLAGDGIAAQSCLLDWERGPAELLNTPQWSEVASTGLTRRATILLGDPFTCAPSPILNTIAPLCAAPIGGGLLSGSSQPGGNVLIAGNASGNTGIAVLGIEGALRCNGLVSQSCRPIGRPMVITAAHADKVIAIGGRPAAEAAREAILTLPDPERELVGNGLKIGVVRDEYQTHFGASDFLVREIVGIDEKTGALHVVERPSVGRTVQFHVRDPDAALADLDLALDVQLLDHEPAVGVFMTESRQRRMAEVDLQQLHDRLGPIPIAGMSTAGEFAGGGGEQPPAIHCASTSALIFRNPED